MKSEVSSAAAFLAAAEKPYCGLGLCLPDTYIERHGSCNSAIEFGKVLYSGPYLDKDISCSTEMAIRWFT